jgi:hypothetical protein
MDVHLAPAHVYTLNPTIEFESTKQQAIDKRLGVVGGGLGGLFSRPKPEEVDLAYSEIRLEPFWHLVCVVRYVFERNKTFNVAVTGPEVRKVTLLGQEFEVAAPQPAQGGGGLLQQIGIGGAARNFSLSGTEYCVDENRQERFLDAANVGQVVQLGAEYVKKDKTELTDLSALTSAEAVVLPPQSSATQIVKTLLTTMIKQIQADKVLEDAVHIETLDLYFRPVYAFELNWHTKNKTGVAEFDAVTGNLIAGKVVRTKSETPINREALFDINASTVASLVPSAAGNVNLVS